MGFNLKNFLEEKIADINPFDGGQTAQTVRANRVKPAPAQTVTRPKQQLQVGSARPGNLSLGQPKPQRLTIAPIARPTMPKPAPVVQQDPLKQLGKIAGDVNKAVYKPVEDITRGLAGIAQRAGTTVGQTGVGLYGAADTAGSLISGDRAGAQRKNRDYVQAIDKMGQGTAIDGGNTSFLTKEVRQGKASPVEFGKQFTNAGVETSSLVPAGRVLSGVQKAAGFNPAIAKNILATNAKQAGVFGTATTANDALQGREVNAQSLAMNYGAPLALGTASEFGGVALAKGAKSTAKAAKNVNQKIEQTNPRVKELDTARVNMQRAFDVEKDPVRRAQINKGLAQLNNERLTLTQGGYAKVPFGKEPAEGLNPTQAKFVNDYAEMLEKMGSGNGVDILPETGVRATNNYLPNELGGNGVRTKEQWFDLAREQLEANKAPYGMGDEYKRITNAKEQPQKIPTAREYSPEMIKSSKFVQSFKEPATARDIKTDIAIQKSLENANTDVSELVDAIANMKGMNKTEATAYVKTVADQSGIDITTGRPTRVVKDGDVIKPLVDDEGNVLDTKDIDTKKPRLPDALGAQHAVVMKEGHGQRVYAYRDNDGNARTFIKQKNPDGSWGTLDKSDVPIKSNYNLIKIQRLADDATINQELLKARDDGVTRGFIWAEGGDRSDVASILKDKAKQKPLLYDPQKHYVEGGVVRRRDSGDVLGNYVQVGPNGVRVHVGKHMIDMGEIDFSKLKNINKTSYSADRMIEEMTPNEATREALRELLINPAQRGERLMRVEGAGIAKELNNWEKTLDSAVPKSQRKQFHQDVASYIERKLAPSKEMVERLGPERTMSPNVKDEIISETYGPLGLKAVKEYDGFVRAFYDNLLNRINETRTSWGFDEIPRRADYLTHIKELNGNPILQTWDDFSSSVMGDVTDGAGRRGALPTSPSGQSKDFRPVMKYMPFAKKRFGDDTPEDAINPLREYSAIALHNIHMTEPAALARGFETALRSADEMRTNMPDPKGLTRPQKELWDKTKTKLENTGDKGRLAIWSQEQANVLSGKTPSGDRFIIDTFGKVGEVGLRTIRQVSGITSRTGILGNASSVLAQTLSMPNVLPKVGPKSAVKGLFRTLNDIGSDSPTWKNSDAMVSRYTDANLLHRGKLRKISDATGIPLRTVEQAMVTTQYNMFFEKALEKGLKGQKAIEWATRESGKVVPWRGIGDTAHLYNNKAFNSTIAKFIREPVEQTRHFIKDLTPKQKLAALVLYSAANLATTELTGRKYMPDPIASTIETVGDVLNTGDDKDEKFGTDAIQAGQRFASDAVTAAPLFAQGFNALPQEVRKQLFGEESPLGRYDGALAITSPISNVTQAAGKAWDGNVYDAVGDVLAGTVTAGNQIRKTMQGGEALAKGYTESSGGRVQTAVDQNPYNTAKGLLFGKNALSEQQAFYKNNQKVLGEKQSDNLKSLSGPEKVEYSKLVQDNRKAGKTTPTGSSPAEQLKADNQNRSKQFSESFSKEDRAIAELSKADQERLIKSGAYTQAKIDGVNNYEKKMRKELGYEDSGSKSDKSYKTEYKELEAKIKSPESKKWSAVERAKKEKDLKYLSVKKDYDKDTVGLYHMSKTDAYNLVSTNKDGKAMVEKIVKYGDALVEAGLSTKNKYRDKNGNLLLNAPGTKSGGGKGKGKGGKKSAKGKFDYKLFGFSGQGKSDSKQLYDLLKSAKLKANIA